MNIAINARHKCCHRFICGSCLKLIIWSVLLFAFSARKESFEVFLVLFEVILSKRQRKSLLEYLVIWTSRPKTTGWKRCDIFTFKNTIYYILSQSIWVFKIIFNTQILLFIHFLDTPIFPTWKVWIFSRFINGPIEYGLFNICASRIINWKIQDFGYFSHNEGSHFIVVGWD